MHFIRGLTLWTLQTIQIGYIMSNVNRTQFVGMHIIYRPWFDTQPVESSQQITAHDLMAAVSLKAEHFILCS